MIYLSDHWGGKEILLGKQLIANAQHVAKGPKKNIFTGQKV